VAVYPFPKIVVIKRDEKAIPLTQTGTPLLLPNLELGDYEIILESQSHQRVTVKIPRSALKVRKTYVLWGRMEDGGPPLSVTEESP
jgi:hypothetical protein